MNRLIIICCAGSFFSVADAQDRAAGQWSVMGDLNYCSPVSQSMHGNPNDFANQFAASYTNTNYPFAGTTAANIPAGLQVAFGIAGSKASVFLGYHGTAFVADNLLSSNANVMKEELDISTLTAGAEYSLLQRSAVVNPFVRGGITLNWIGGFIEVSNGLTKTFISTETRMGIEAECGVRWNVAGGPIGVELSADYLDANLIGKSYTAPTAQPPDVLGQRTLNDGADPNNPQDHARTIDYLSVRFGLRYWF